jgi:hypothetical protein
MVPKRARQKSILFTAFFCICSILSLVLYFLSANRNESHKTWPNSFGVRTLAGEAFEFRPFNQRVVVLSNDCNYCDSLVNYLRVSDKFIMDTNVVLFWINKKKPEYSFDAIDSVLALKPNFLLNDTSLNVLAVSAYPSVYQLQNGKELASVIGLNRSLLRSKFGY